MLQGYDLIEDMYSAKTAAVNFVHELCKQRSKGNLDAFMQFIVQVMTEYQVGVTTDLSGALTHCRIAVAALLCHRSHIHPHRASETVTDRTGCQQRQAVWALASWEDHHTSIRSCLLLKIP